MAAQTPSFVQNENIHIHRGKGVDAGGKANVLKPGKANVLKPEKSKKGLKDRKALADLGKPLPSKSAVNLKDKTVLRGTQTTRKLLTAKTSDTVKPNSLLSEEDIRNCHRWAKEGIEQVHFTGNDLQKLDRDAHQERVRKEVEMVISSLQAWTDMAYDLGLPISREVAKDSDVITKLELEPEITLHRTRSMSISGSEEIDALFEAEIPFPIFDDNDFVLELKESDDDMPCI